MRKFTKRGALVVLQRQQGPDGEMLCAVARCQCCGQETVGLILRANGEQYVVCVDCVQRAAQLFVAGRAAES